MAESVRELVVTMSLEAGNFSKTATNIQQQIKNVESAFRAMGDGTGAWGNTLDGQKAKLASLGSTLQLQQSNVANYARAWVNAKAALDSATDEKSRLAAAKHLTSVETNLNNAKAAATATAAEMKRLQTEINAFRFDKFGTAMQTAGQQMQQFGRSMSIYVTAPLVALGTKAYNAASEYESAMARLQISTDGTADTMQALKVSIEQMSIETPMSFVEIADLMKTLADAGVPIQNLEKMARVIASLGATSDVGAAESAQAIMQFLTVLGASQDDVERMASTLVELGRSSVATGGQIFEMAQRMAATGNLAGLSAPDILALAAAFASMGIEAQAGGTSASKLMKAMQLAAETGKGLNDVVSKTGEVTIGFTTVMGVTEEQFKRLWGESPTKAMLLFFNSLADGAKRGDASVLSMLDSMGMTEIRLSNLIAAAASNPDFFATMLETSNTAWAENTALVEAAGIAYGTTEAKASMTMNKLSNASADMGENVIKAIQPLLEKLTGMIDKFNELDEATQTTIVEVAGAFALLGPAAMTIGTVTKAIGSMSSGISSMIKHGPQIAAFFSNPVTWGVAAGGALLLGVNYIANLPSQLDLVAQKAKDIPINLDKAKVDELQRVIDETQGKMDKLRGGETTTEGENTTTAVKMGFGTDNMFAQALGYESGKLKAQTSEIISDYAARIKEIEDAIASNPVDLGNEKRLAEIEKLKNDMGRALSDANAAYTKTVGEMFSGMTSVMGAGAEDLKRAAALYDLYGIVYDTMTKAENGDLQASELASKFTEINKQAVALGFEDTSWSDAYYANLMNLAPKIGEAMNEMSTIVGEQDYGMTLLQAILNDTEAVAGLDVSAIEGALDGALSTVDWKAAAIKADGDGDFGAYLTQGLADGVTANTETVKTSMVTLKDDTLAALLAAFQMQSPSRLMAAQGINIPAGVAVGILNGIPLAANAMNALGAAITAIAAAQGAAAGAAYGGAFGNTASASFSVALGKIRKELTALENRISTGYGSHYNVGGR
jgi:TP901 family phage tail tape measure protein